MTRTGALNVLKEHIPVMAGAYGEFLDAFVALGMLKPDEPKSVEDRAVKVLSQYAVMPLHVIHDLAVEGLKIVEK